jgi:hypothetical protein
MDIAQYAQKNVVFKDGKINRLVTVEDRKIASEELPKIPVLEEELE